MISSFQSVLGVLIVEERFHPPFPFLFKKVPIPRLVPSQKKQEREGGEGGGVYFRGVQDKSFVEKKLLKSKK